MLYLEMVLYVFLGLLGVGMLRNLLIQYFPRVREIYLDGIYIVLVLITALLLLPKATSERELRESQKAMQQKLGTTQKALQEVEADLASERGKRENAAEELLKTQKELGDTRDQLAQKDALRHWAMMFPTGEIARNANSLAKVPAGKRGDDFRKVFESPQDGKFLFGGAKCHNEEYVAAINALIEKYEQSPYPYVALAFCLKNREDPSWKKVAEKAKRVLETFLNIEPRVLTIDAFYGSLIKDILEEKIALEDTGFFVKSSDGRYRSKNSPPP